MNVQAPPNLAPDALELLLSAGLNDWGGVSPLTIDFINPEAPWPTLHALRERTEAAGAKLRERLPVYPDAVARRPELFDPQVRAALQRLADESGFARPRDGARQEAA
jgi:FO synthase